ncbi:tRNA N(3)-methylcytidine methyltransferase METTL6 isoform X4 [Maniola hyperantus]|uniref:tRNA N(3)-methylcytidine methyltransferase METTL6 isoform X4 n=1 Tax=Aphantopus hyperantus TaxID=2795564 RepID=UPI0037486DA9
METDETVGANGDVFVHRLKELTEEEKQRLELQNSRMIPEGKASKLEREARRHWDLFYKRNETKFFRDRHWTTPITPNAWAQVAKIAYRALKPGGMLLLRDYGRYDMAQLRFKPGHKIADNFYMRQDGTRSYYFTEEELASLFSTAGFEILMNTYVQRRTVNFKEGIDVPRIFVQGKYKKPSTWY